MTMRGAGLVAACLLVGGCSAILGVNDIFLDEKTAGTEEGGAPDAAALPEGSVPVEGGPPTDCKADLASDPLNCGQCGYDCVGGACKAGKCEPVLLVGGLEQANGIAVAASGVFITTLAGEVLRVDKDGKNKKVLATGQEDARGVVVDGTTVYWSNGDFPFVQGQTSKGGVWKCEIANCVPQLVVAANWAMNVTLRDGWLYFAENNNSQIVRVRPDGTASAPVASANKPFGVVADGTHVYYTSNSNSVSRSPVAGGPAEVVGANNGITLTFITLDTERAYWTVTETGGKGRVFSVAKAMLGGSTIEYGTDNVFAYGIAVDDRYVYWSNDGTESGPGVSAENGDVRACPKQGCAASGPIVLADKLVFAGPIAVDDKAVYWVELGNPNQASGRVRKVARPR